MFHIGSHQVDADLHSNVKPTHTLENDSNLKHWREELWRKMWSHGRSHVPLAGMENGAATWEAVCWFLMKVNLLLLQDLVTVSLGVCSKLYSHKTCSGLLRKLYSQLPKLENN